MWPWVVIKTHRLDYQHNHWCGPGSGYLRPLANDEYHNRNKRFSVVVYLAQDLWHRKMQLRQQIQATEIWKCHLINVSTENHVSDSFTHCLICFEFYQSFFIKGNIKIADISRMWAYRKKKFNYDHACMQRTLDSMAMADGWHGIDTLRLRQNGQNTTDIYKCIFLNENMWISAKISLKFVPRGPIKNIPALVQMMDFHWPDDKPLSEPIMVSLLMHIFVTQPQ